jgi:Mg2+/Co2+ transporter CorB
MKAETVTILKSKIKKNKISGWPQLHTAYEEIGNEYAADKLQHAVASLLDIKEMTLKNVTTADLAQWLNDSTRTMEWITAQIKRSREKDYKNPFRQLAYESEKEMNAVIGSLEDNSFINQTISDLEVYKTKVNQIISEWEL